MISVSDKKWSEATVNKNLIEKVKQDFLFDEIISKLIILRKFDFDQILFPLPFFMFPHYHLILGIFQYSNFCSNFH